MITGLEFSLEDPDFLYIAATDCEVRNRHIAISDLICT